MIRLWLDDVRPAPEGWTWVKTVSEAQYYLSQGNVDEVSFDHDLGDVGILTGYDLVKWMGNNDIWSRQKPRVHSMNPVGRRSMEGYINRYFPEKDED